MPRLEFSEHFANGLATLTSPRVEERVMRVLDVLETFGELGSSLVPESITRRYGGNVRKVADEPLELVYTFYPDEDLVRVEALVYGRSIR